MNKRVLMALSAVLGVAAGIILEKRTSWFDHLMLDTDGKNGEDGEKSGNKSTSNAVQPSGEKAE